jgi:hypothetical protein
MTTHTQASNHAFHAMWAAQMEITCCARSAAHTLNDPDRRLRALTAGRAAIHLAFSAFDVLENPISVEIADALYVTLAATRSIFENTGRIGEWTSFDCVLSKKISNPHNLRFIDTRNIRPGDVNDCIEAWGWRNLKLYLNEAKAHFENGVSAKTTDSERQQISKWLVKICSKAELASWALETKNMTFICETVDEILTVERDFIERPHSL